MSDYFGRGNKDNMHGTHQSEKTVDHVSLYLTHLAFGAATGGNAPCSNMFGTLSTISSHYKIKKQDSCNDMFIYSVANPLQGETKWECTKCELSPCHQKSRRVERKTRTKSAHQNSESSHIISQALDLKRWKWRRGLRGQRRGGRITRRSVGTAKYLPSGYALGYASGKFFEFSRFLKR
ncbi:hypothetical protein T03_2184 [Trichinella britovi]|uniref:Uncharacterized protein n=1 Tax=Trichinella britovi TaxID=45882 RepID=A0A0V1D687_TRIBR|nr:hypothetical protein T03_2184 [Trichinella britovi]